MRRSFASRRGRLPRRDRLNFRQRLRRYTGRIAAKRRYNLHYPLKIATLYLALVLQSFAYLLSFKALANAEQLWSLARADYILPRALAGSLFSEAFGVG
jgi:hypothetical protein